MANRKHLLHVKSLQTEEKQLYGLTMEVPKRPKETDILEGEIAVNFADGHELLCIKNSNGNIVGFLNENNLYEAEEIITDGLTTEKLEREEALANLDNKMATTSVSKIVSVTYGELKSLRDNSQLKPGQSYRITDFVTTTTQENTQSAAHPFDVIVLATDVNVLNENAKAIKHDGDTYFDESNLDAWEIKYSLDNDSTKFAWADTANGKGVIFYMKDEWNNECPYDFKNIMFKRWAITNVTSTKLSTAALQNLNNTFNFTTNGGKHFAAKNISGNWMPGTGTAVIEITVDENNSAWYYTFNGMSSEDGETINEMYDVSTKSFKLTDECIQFMEKEGSGGNFKDTCYNNVIVAFQEEYVVDDVYYTGRMVLNDIVFNNGLSYCYYNETDEYWEYNTSDCDGNRFDSDCYSNTFGNSCSGNTFGNGGNSNTFGNYCGKNTFGDNCAINTFGNDCYNNTFGSSCTRNTFGNSCSGNTFGNGGNSNTFGNNCGKNTFGDNCAINTFGNDCDNNTFGNKWGSNTFGNDCDNNTFGDSCIGNMFGNVCYNNTFGNSCSNNMFGNYCGQNAFENSYQNNTFGNYCNTNTFGNHCQSNTFGNDCYNITFGNSCQNNTFGDGCSDNTFGNYCRFNSVGNGCIYISFTKDYMRYNIVENGNKYIAVTSTETTSSSTLLRNITVSQGVNSDGTISAKKTISHNTTNDTFKTTYYSSTKSVDGATPTAW